MLYLRLEKGNIYMHTRLFHVADMETQPLPVIVPQSFQKYLERHRLTIRDVAQASHVRLLVVWNILHNNPISSEDAGRVRSGLFALTRERYHNFIQVHGVPRAFQPASGSKFTQKFARIS